MTNHPNRSWRYHMRAACAIWLESWGWKYIPSEYEISQDELRDIMRGAYCDGYEAGRASLQPQTKTGE